MGIFDLFKKNENAVEKAKSAITIDDAAMKVNLTKRVNLGKEEVSKVCLAKPILNGLKAHVGLVLDYSGSMDYLYHDGTVQGVIDMILPLAMQFDDDGQMEVWIFENGFHRLPDVTLDNLYGYVEREILDKYRMGGTNYAGVVKDVTKEYGGLKVPSYVMFLTDGDNSDKRETDAAIKNASKKPIFWQFVGLGSASFEYLEHLDDMDGRYVDNADFFKVETADKITYKDLLNEFPEWLNNSKVKDMLK